MHVALSLGAALYEEGGNLGHGLSIRLYPDMNRKSFAIRSHLIWRGVNW